MRFINEINKCHVLVYKNDTWQDFSQLFNSGWILEVVLWCRMYSRRFLEKCDTDDM